MGNKESKPAEENPSMNAFEKSSKDTKHEKAKPEQAVGHRSVKKTPVGIDLRKKLQNTPIGEKDLAAFTPPKFEKTEEENSFLWKTIRQNFILNHLDDAELANILDACERVVYNAGDDVYKQGDAVDYYYLLYSGECIFNVDGEDIGDISPGTGFGELALLHATPRLATVTATAPAVCFRIDQKSFRYLMLSQKQRADTEKLELLRKVEFLKDLDVFQLRRLGSAMTRHSVKEGTYLCQKGEASRNLFCVIYEGEVLCTDIFVGDTTIDEVTVGPGAHLGERTIFTGEPFIGNALAKTDVTAFTIDGDTFKEVMGSLENLVCRARDVVYLQGIECIKNTHLDSSTIETMASLIEETTFNAGSTIMTEGESTEPALYIIRSGKCHVTTKDGTRDDILSGMATFGADHFKEGNGGDTTTAVYTTVAVEETTCGVLKLKDCRSIFDTSLIGQNKKPAPRRSQIEMALRLEDLSRHAILGQGSFGQVWLVSTKDGQDNDMPYAMKIQSKYQLIESGQAQGVVNELEIMNQLHHPFLLPLIKTFQDKDCVYMLLGIVQGGELLYRIYSDDQESMPEKESKFYAAGILEGLAYMHRKQIVHRDLKPENVLIDNQGYPVIIDFGFAKHVPEKTYTFCGTPLYIAPEVILNRGHNFGVDYWALGCIIYEMITGDTPFFESGMEQIDMYKKICLGRFSLQPLFLHKDALDLVLKILEVKPFKRLGSLARGQRDIFEHEWFSEIDFSVLRNKEIEAPWVPAVENVLDTSNFCDKNHLSDRSKESSPEISEEDQQLFELFGVL